MRALKIRSALLFGLVLVLATTAWADYKESYAKGMRAVDNDDWAEAATWMQQALAENPSETKKKIKLYGNRFVPYLPHYHLGLALFKQGDCQGALTSWATSEAQGQVQSTGEFKDLQSLREDCAQQEPVATPTAVPPTAVPPTPTPAGPDPAQLLAAARQQAASEIDSADRAEKELLRRRQDPAYEAVWSGSSQFGDRQTQAADALARAREELATGISKKDLAAVENATRLAEQARRSYGTLSAAVDSRRNQLAREAADAERQAAAARERVVNEIAALTPAASEAMATGGSLSQAGQATVGSERSRLEGLVARAGSAGDGSQSVQDLEALRDELEQATSSYRDVVNRVLAEESRPVPPTPTRVVVPTATPTPVVERPTPVSGREAEESLTKLRTASTALLSGDYVTALVELGGVEVGGRAGAVAHLVRAASNYYLFYEGDKKDTLLEEAAVDEVRLCRSVDAAVVPDLEYFSPGFVDFFEGTVE